MHTTTNTLRRLFNVLLIACALGMSLGLVACSDDGTAEECDPAASSTCFCEDSAGALCNPDTSDDCTCEDVGDLCAEVTCGDGETCDPSDGQCITFVDDFPTEYRFVLIEDRTANVSGEYPGADLDAVSVTRFSDGALVYAASVEDFNLGGGAALDTAQILGAPDAACDASSGKFVALGGQDADGFIIVGFSNADQNATFGAGAQITVHEVGATECPGSNFDDDPYTVSISVSTDRASFTQIGEAVNGTATVTVP